MARKNKTPVVLITGASSGFGKESAREFSRRGWQVFGTSRHPENVSEVYGNMLQLDVRDDESVKLCVAQVMKSAGRIDVLVNNAGFVLNGFAEETSIEDVQNIFQTNFLGTVRMTQRVLPIMRRQLSGKIINISSLAGLVGVPYRAFYSAGKFALEGYTRSLRYELLPFNIFATLVEPGFFRTSLDKSMVRARDRLADYDFIRKKLDDYFARSIRRGADPAEVARIIVRISHTDRPVLFYRVGRDARWLPAIKSILPKFIYEKGVRKWFKLCDHPDLNKK